MNEVVIEILGSGGATTIPRPLCDCRICEEARQKGYPYKRTGPSVFIHGPDILFDTPEEIKEQIERSGIKNIKAAFYSHWHPDHTAGNRVWEMNKAHRIDLGRVKKTTPIYLPSNIIESFKRYRGLEENCQFLDKCGFTKTQTAPLDRKILFDGVMVTPFQMAEEYVAGFDIETKGKRALIIMDENLGWSPREDQTECDLVIMPIGVVEFHPLTGKRIIRENHPILTSEPTFEKVLQMVRQLKAKRVILSHIGEGDQLSYDELLQIAKKMKDDGLPIDFAYDGMKITL